ncbi:hypothetical protein ACN47E_004010 [Coniothyrium glycines]
MLRSRFPDARINSLVFRAWGEEWGCPYTSHARSSPAHKIGDGKEGTIGIWEERHADQTPEKRVLSRSSYT